MDKDLATREEVNAMRGGFESLQTVVLKLSDEVKNLSFQVSSLERRLAELSVERKFETEQLSTAKKELQSLTNERNMAKGMLILLGAVGTALVAAVVKLIFENNTKHP